MLRVIDADAALDRDAAAPPERRWADLARRVAIAGAALPVVAAALWFGGPSWNLLLAAAGALAAFGYYGAVFGRVSRASYPGVAATAALPLLPAALAGSIVAAAAAGFWNIAGAAVVAWLFQSARRSVAGATEAVGHVLAGVLFAGPGLFALAALRADPSDGRAWACALLLVTWSSGAGARAASRAARRIPLARWYGAGRTREDVVGGALVAVAATALARALLLPGMTPAEVAALAGGAAVFGPLADLAMSAVQPTHRGKRSGRLRPGGLLARVAALLWTSLLIAAVRAIAAA